MHNISLRRPITVFGIVGLLAFPASRSDPVAVYATIDRVVLAPDDANPTSIQVWGTISTTDQKMGDNYRPAVKGYLYYSINPANERAARAEWADLKSLEGKKQMVGFGNKYQQSGIGRVRCATETPAQPDMYPVGGIGVVKLGSTRNSGWELAKTLLNAKAPDASCSKGK